MFRVYINGELAGEVAAPDYHAARIAARSLYGRRVDVIGYLKGIRNG